MSDGGLLAGSFVGLLDSIVNVGLATSRCMLNPSHHPTPTFEHNTVLIIFLTTSISSSKSLMRASFSIPFKPYANFPLGYLDLLKATQQFLNLSFCFKGVRKWMINYQLFCLGIFWAQSPLYKFYKCWFVWPMVI